MMKVNIKAKGRKLSIPIPYTLLHLIIRVLTSERVLSFVNREIENKGKGNWKIPNICRNDLQPLLRELSEQKGLLLVETSLKDGTKVSIRL